MFLLTATAFIRTVVHERVRYESEYGLMSDCIQTLSLPLYLHIQSFKSNLRNIIFYRFYFKLQNVSVNWRKFR